MHNMLSELRRQHGFTQEELAEKIGTSQKEISRIEVGERRLTIEWVERYARALGVTLSAMFADFDGEKHLVKISGTIDKNGEITMSDATRTIELPSILASDNNVIVLVLEEDFTALAKGWAVVCKPLSMGEPMENLPLMVQLDDGRYFMRRLLPGSKPGLWNLQMDGRETQKDVRIKSAYKILHIKAGS